MMLLVIFSLFFSHVYGSPIVEGEKSDINEHPWLASLQKNGQHICGGSIISESIILTAAHCTNNQQLDSLTIRVGSSTYNSGGSYHNVVAIKQHENYTMTLSDLIKIRNDLALVKVTPSFTFHLKVAKIILPQKDSVVSPGAEVSVAGWGSNSVKGPAIVELRVINLHIRNSVRCSKAFGDETGKQIDLNKQICATDYGGPGFCYGDSGSPLVTKDGHQVGIVSWSNGCSHLMFPGVYGDVARYRDWIDTNSQELESDVSLLTKIVDFFKN